MHGIILSMSWIPCGLMVAAAALLMCAAIVMYGWSALDLVRLALAGAMHLVVGWIYLVASPLCLPRHQATTAQANPFA